jgi:hypothetical protein
MQTNFFKHGQVMGNAGKMVTFYQDNFLSKALNLGSSLIES